MKLMIFMKMVWKPILLLVLLLAECIAATDSTIATTRTKHDNGKGTRKIEPEEGKEEDSNNTRRRRAKKEKDKEVEEIPMSVFENAKADYFGSESLDDSCPTYSDTICGKTFTDLTLTGNVDCSDHTYGIILDNDETGSPTLDCGNYKITGSGSGGVSLVDVETKPGTIKNCIFDCNDVYGYAITQDCEYEGVRIENVSIEGCKTAGLKVGSHSTLKDVIVTGGKNKGIVLERPCQRRLSNNISRQLKTYQTLDNVVSCDNEKADISIRIYGEQTIVATDVIFDKCDDTDSGRYSMCSDDDVAHETCQSQCDLVV